MYRICPPFLIFVLLTLDTSPLPAQEGLVVERIEVRGNQKTKPEVILRSLGLRKGDRLTREVMRAGREALYRTRLFRTVHLAPRPGSEVGKAVLMVYVDEKRFGDLGISLIYTELDGFGVALDAYHVNLWGNGRLIGAEFNYGERLRHAGFTYTHPWLSGADLSLYLQAAMSSSNRDLYRSKKKESRGGYDLDRTGGSIGIERPVWGDYRLIFKYGFTEVAVANYREPAVQTNGGLFASEVGAAVGQRSVGFLGLDLGRTPTEIPWGSAPGVDFNLQLDLSTIQLGSQKNFLRVKAEVYRHFRTFSGQTLSFGGRAGTIFGSPPFHERFYLDGPNQLRGFEQREIGPEGGTRFLSAEGVYFVPLKKVGKVYFFVEGAGVSRSAGGKRRNDVDGTLGIGVLLLNRVDISLGLGTGTLIVKSHRFGGINVGL